MVYFNDLSVTDFRGSHSLQFGFVISRVDRLDETLVRGLTDILLTERAFAPTATMSKLGMLRTLFLFNGRRVIFGFVSETFLVVLTETAFCGGFFFVVVVALLTVKEAVAV